MARGGQIIDASIVPVPTQRNSRDENAELQAGRTPAGWKQKPAKLRQKDRDARWIKKHGCSFFGYKIADVKHKLIRHYAVTGSVLLRGRVERVSATRLPWKHVIDGRD
jgi:transposase, IS5 family